MKTKLTKKEYIIVASMLFGLFFGAGNLIFPVSMGQNAGLNVIPAAIGFCITGVGFPLLGIAAMGISESKDLFDMSSKVGRGFAYFFTCALYLTIGPFFAIPRTATVSFQVGIASLVPENTQQLALGIFSFIFFGAVLFFSLRPSGILTWIGKILNPVFLFFMAVLIIIAVVNPMGSIGTAEAVGDFRHNSFMTGFVDGYNTMDALASLAFGIILIDVIKKLGVKDSKSISMCTIKSGVFSVLLMAFIYCSLAVMGAQSVNILGINADGGTALYYIARHYFGSIGGIFLGIMITFACLKTSIGLVTAFSSTFSEMFPKFISYKICVIVCSLFSFIVSNIGLSKIIEISLPVLLFLYPVTIVLITLGLFGRFFNYRRTILVSTVTLTIIPAFLDAVIALPEGLKRFVPGHSHLTELTSALPFSNVGMGWITPAIAGFVLGCLIVMFRSFRRTASDAG